MSFIDLTGKHFVRLDVIKRIENNKYGEAMWLCKCTCGKEVKAKGSSLIRGAVKSCGCYSHDCTRQRNKDKARHGFSRTRLYREWSSMKSRCMNSKHKDYKNYGGRGIIICDDWLISDNFFEWAMNNGYKDDLTIDRINVNGNYEPNNCRFASPKEQIRNRRNTIVVEYEGKKIALSELAEIVDVPYPTLHWRYRNKSTMDEMIKPVRNYCKTSKLYKELI